MKTINKIGIISLAFFLFISCKKEKQPNIIQVPSIQVTSPIVRDITLTKQYPGFLSSDKTVNLVARVNGYLQTSFLKAGAFVKKGTLIFIIEPEIYKNNVIQAEASLKTSQAQLEYARNNYIRIVEAAKSGAVSQIQVLQAKSTAEEMEAAVRNAEAALKTAQTNLDYCYIRAPYDGRITESNYDVGNYINGAVQPVTLATLYKDDIMYANFDIEDSQFLQMQLTAQSDSNHINKNKTPVTIQIGKNGREIYTGTMDYLAPNIDLSTGTLKVRANVKNSDGTLKSGLYVTITLPYNEQTNAILVRDASIGTDQLGKFLYVVNDSNIVKHRRIEIGQLINDTLRQVIKGIQPNEQYVTTALLKVKEGMNIKPIK